MTRSIELHDNELLDYSTEVNDLGGGMAGAGARVGSTDSRASFIDYSDLGILYIVYSPHSSITHVCLIVSAPRV